MSTSLNDKLNLIQDARDNMKLALENKGQTVSNDIRTYSAAINNIVSSDKLNLYVQLDEPEDKNGLWIKTEKAYTDFKWSLGSKAFTAGFKRFDTSYYYIAAVGKGPLIYLFTSGRRSI